MSQQINLFNPIFRRQKKYLSAVTMAQALGLILLGAVLLTFYAGYRSSRLAADAAEANNQLKAVQAQLAQVTAAFPPRKKSEGLEAQIRKVEEEMVSLQKAADVLRDGQFGSTTGHAEYLRAFARQSIDGVWLTGFSIQGAGTEISLQGRALKPELVPAYINRLKREAVLQGKSFSALHMQVPRLEQVVGATEKEKESVSVAAPFVEFNLQSMETVAQPARPGEVVQQ